uniref:R-spondin 4 n=1 Tax=Athene cunicularia TaxID=194338 RepID=A0A663NDG8_ATHCN
RGCHGGRDPRRRLASAGLLENCTGCVLCSEDNGCITCHHRLFLALGPQRVLGLPAPGSPRAGPRARRGDQPSFLAECRSPSCESCFSRDFCMKCKDKFYLHKGQCFRQCPPSTAAQPGTRECQGKEHPPPPAQTCEPGPWSEWSACTHEGRTCGCKWGVETRVREVPGATREEGAACPALLETRKCRMRKHCPGGEYRSAGPGRRSEPPPAPAVPSSGIRSCGLAVCRGTRRPAPPAWQGPRAAHERAARGGREKKMEKEGQ